MNKIIVISTVGLIYDGITSVIVSYLEAMNCSDVKIYVVDTIRSENEIINKIERLGCEVVHLPSRRDRTAEYFFSLISFIRKNRIDVMHVHGNSSILSIELLASFIGGCKKRIAHSHNTKCDHTKANRLLKPLFNALYTDGLACGEEAGKWLFGNREFTVLKNGRNIKKYQFDKSVRELMRDKLSVGNALVIGHVGGFFEQKNHVFLMQIFREIYQIYPDSKFVLIGDGPLREKMETCVSDLKDAVKFIGTVDDVENYLQAMDAMILPSLFEGLPLAAIEWQINGLPSLLSDTITKECAITNTVEFESLESSPAVWARKILKMVEQNDREYSSNEAVVLMKSAGFDINDNAQVLKSIYLDL